MTLYREFKKCDSPTIFFIGMGGLVRIYLLALLPFLPLHFQDNAWLANISVSLFLFSDIVGGVVVGYLSDRFNVRRVTLILSILIGCASLLLYFLPTIIISIHLGIISVIGFSLSGLNVSFSGILVQLAPPDQKKRLFHIRYWVFNVASLVGLVFGWVYSSFLNTAQFFLFAAVLSLVISTTLFFKSDYFLKIESAQRATIVRIKDILRSSFQKGFVVIMLVSILIALAHQQLTSNYPLYLTRFSENGGHIYSILLIINTLILVLFQGLVLKITEKGRILKALVFMFLPLGMMFFSFPVIWVTSIAMIIYSIGEMAIFPTVQYISEKYYPVNIKASMFGVFNISRIGFVLGPVGGWWLVEKSSYPTLFIASALILLIMIMTVLSKETDNPTD